MKLCNETYFNRRNWILEKMEDLELSAEEIMVLLCIDYMNEFHKTIDVHALAQKLKKSKNETDDLLAGLMAKGYLTMESRNRSLYYNIDRVFQMKADATVVDTNEYKALFSLYEQEFKRPLSQWESEQLSEWIETYDIKLIKYALREALIHEVLNFNYIHKILKNWDQQHYTASMYEGNDE